MNNIRAAAILIVQIGLLVEWFPEYAHAQWVEQQSLSETLYHVNFPTQQVGFVVGEYHLFATSDGGLHWSIRPTRPGNRVFFSNESLGLSTSYYIMKTTNKGMSWYQTQAPFYGEVYQSVSFVDSNVGWVVGNGGMIRKTTDGGETWQLQQSGTSQNLFSVFFVTPQNGWAVGFASLRTTDGGNTWNDFQVPSFGRFTKIFFVDTGHGFILGDRNLIVSSDSGNTWIEKPRAPGYIIFNAVAFKDSVTGWVGGYGDTPLAHAKILKTTDAGSTWQLQYDLPNAEVYSMCFTDSNNGWAVGSYTFAKTTNGGLTFIEEEPTNSLPTTFVLKQNYPNPFNSTTTISYDLPRGSRVVLSVFDILGREVALLVDEFQETGRHQKSFNADGLASGVYIYRLKTDGTVQNRKMTIEK
jgi:photosystem II stability/assembly factor-like uncharacterized protein